MWIKFIDPFLPFHFSFFFFIWQKQHGFVSLPYGRDGLDKDNLEWMLEKFVKFIHSKGGCE
jgi:hypothetical protein